jgi:hypothetical protein
MTLFAAEFWRALHRGAKGAGIVDDTKLRVGGTGSAEARCPVGQGGSLAARLASRAKLSL